MIKLLKRLFRKKENEIVPCPIAGKAVVFALESQIQKIRGNHLFIPVDKYHRSCVVLHYEIGMISDVRILFAS